VKNFILLLILCTIIFYLPAKAQTGIKNKGLIFKKDLEYRAGDSTYTDVIQLMNLNGNVHALQFRLLMNKSEGDSTVLVFKDIEKGSDLSDPAWLLDHNVKKGSTVSNGASKDEIFVVLYNTSLKGGLSPGDYPDLIRITYKVAKLPAVKKEIKSSLKISHIQASTFDGFPVDIKPSRDLLKINVRKK
jgi:hypothetical protein